jgi:hypothetical protein
VTLITKSEKTYGSTFLPAGSARSDFELKCFLKVYNSLDSYTKSDFVVMVLKSNLNNISEIAKYVNFTLQRASSAKYSNYFKQTITLSTHLINSIDCTLAPN